MDVADYQFDGNHTIASRIHHPWRKQFNILVAYTSFYDPFRILKAVVTIDHLWKFRIMYQVLGNLGLLRSAWAGRSWFRRLRSGPIEKAKAVPVPKFRLVLPDLAGVCIEDVDLSPASCGDVCSACRASEGSAE